MSILPREARLKRMNWMSNRVLDILLNRPIILKDSTIIEYKGDGGKGSGVYFISFNGAPYSHQSWGSLAIFYDDIDWERTDR